MVDNSLAKFNTTSEYNDFKASTAYTVPNVSWIVKENAIASEPYLYPLASGIVIHKNGVFREVSYEDFDAHYDDIVLSGYTIEGVIAVPASHTEDGTTRIVSLKYMSTSSPETGTDSSSSAMYWGTTYSDVTALTNYGYVAQINNVSGETTNYANTPGYVPSDAFTSGVQCVADEKAKYYSTSGKYCPSPYITGDDPNPLYRITGVTNALSDMDGSGNTDILVSIATAQADWRTASTITNSCGVGYYPAACCCKRYGTTGVPSGSWYLPSCGELGYVVARLDTINSLLTLIASKDTNIGASVFSGSRFWTSTEYSVSDANRISFSSGEVRGSNKSENYCARAFASVHSTPLIF